MIRASASVAPAASARASARCARVSASWARSSFTGSPLADADLDVAEAGARHGVPHVTRLTWLALAAVRGAEHHVAALVADRVTGPPELVGDAGVRRVLEQPALLAAL